MSACGPTAADNTVCHTYLTTGEVVGLAFNVETGLLSAGAVVVLLALVARNVVRNIRNPPPEGWRLIRTHVDAYVLSLLLFDFVHGLAAVLDLRWVHQQQVFCGTYCSAQGAIRNIGSTGVALSTLAVATHTFLVIFFRWAPPPGHLIDGLVITAIWLFCILFVVLEAVLHPNFYSPTPYWCWISNHTIPRLFGQFIWLWLALAVSSILYFLLYLQIRGNIIVDPNRWTNITFHHVPQSSTKALNAQQETASMAEAQGQARKMLLYPACYSILVLPLSLVRWVAYAKTMPFAASLAAVSIYGLSGIVNCLLFTLTRPNLLLFGQHREQPRAPAASELMSTPVLVIARSKADARSSLSTVDTTPELRMRRMRAGHVADSGSDADDDASSWVGDSTRAPSVAPERDRTRPSTAEEHLL